MKHLAHENLSPSLRLNRFLRLLNIRPAVSLIGRPALHLSFSLFATCGLFTASLRPLSAANLLVNPGFEQNSGHVLPVGWTRFAPTNAQPFGNYWVEAGVPPHSGSLYFKEWGAAYDATITNVAGLFQDFSSAPGSTYQAGGWMYTRGSDVLAPDCYVW